jgi:hypothetical protein
VDDASFAELLASKLADPDLGESLFYGQPIRIARPPPPFEEHVRDAQAAVDAQLKEKSLSPPAAGDALFLRKQAWRHDWLDAGRWRRCLEAFDSWQAWLDLAREWEADGRPIDANAAIAAARWLDPESCRERIRGHLAGRSSSLPARIRVQPDPDFRTRDFRGRHWHAWDMKNHALLDLPSLIAYESDENFSIRTRIYRSLGQRPHPASIQVLQEATFDSHPFARAQAARSLGWCAAPTALARLEELKSDPEGQVTRAAEQARQRIVGYWMFFGEWAPIMADQRRFSKVIGELLRGDLRYLARDLLEIQDDLDRSLEDLRASLRELDPLEEEGGERDYPYWIKLAAQEEEDVRGAKAGPSTLRAAVEKGDLQTRMRALQVISWKGYEDLVPLVESLVSEAEPLGWAARRALRAMNRGTMEQRSRSLL